MLTCFLSLGAATAVENQLSEMNAIKERSQNEKQRWLTTMSRAYKEIMVRRSLHVFLWQCDILGMLRCLIGCRAVSCRVLRAPTLGTCEGFEGGTTVTVEQGEGMGCFLSRSHSDDSVCSDAL